MTALGDMTPLRVLCVKHGTDRTSLARKAGMSRQTLYDIEAGKPYRLDTVQKIADALGEDFDYVRDVLSGKIEVGVEFWERAVA